MKKPYNPVAVKTLRIYKNWKMSMPFGVRSRTQAGEMRKTQINKDKAVFVYTMLKNGVSGMVVDPSGNYRRNYKYLVGWHTTVGEDGTVIKGPDEDIVRLHEEGIL